jgi:hypothetical protein
LNNAQMSNGQKVLIIWRFPTSPRVRVPREAIRGLANLNGSTPLGPDDLLQHKLVLPPARDCGPLVIYVLLIVMSFQPYLIRCSDTVHSDIHSGLHISDLVLAETGGLQDTVREWQRVSEESLVAQCHAQWPLTLGYVPLECRH